MGSKKKTKSTSDQTTTVAPPSWTMPGISTAAGKVTDALNQLPGDKYTGDFVAGYDPALLGQTQDAYAAAAQNSQDLSHWLQQQTQQDPTAAIQAAIAPAYQQLTQQVLPGIKSSSLDSGAYSGDRAMAVLPQQALDQWGQNVQNTAATFENNRLAQLPGLTDEIMKLSAGSGDIYQGIAQLEQQQRQAAINNALQQNQYNYQYPFQGLDIASNLLAQLSGGYGTTNTHGTSTQVQSTGGLGAIASGVLGGLGAIGSFAMPGGGSLGGNFLGSLFK